MKKHINFYIIQYCLFALFAALIYRIWSLQCSGKYKMEQHISEKRVPATRGDVFDARGAMLTANPPLFQVFLDPLAGLRNDQNHTNIEATVEYITKLFPEKSYDYVYGVISTNMNISTDANINTKTNINRHIVMGRTFNSDALALSTNRALFCKCGVDILSKRIYPYDYQFVHIIGYLSRYGEPIKGGIEQKYDRYLRGTDGIIRGVHDAGRREIPYFRKLDLDKIDGADIYLTMDNVLQREVCDELEAAVKEYDASGGKVIIQRVETGEILAMASYPWFSPTNPPPEMDDISRRNRTIMDLYDPGSVMKAVTVAAALNLGLVSRYNTFDIGQGAWEFGGATLHDHPTGVVTVEQIIQKSSNIGAAKIGLLLGKERLAEYIRAFGFGKSTGIDLPGEAGGILRPISEWAPISITRIAMGQGISVTPLQVVCAYNAIANDGKYMRPYVVSKIVASDGSVVFRNEPKVVSRPIRPEVAREMRQILETVTHYDRTRKDHGTGHRARIDGYSVAGKTGTAQMIENGAYSTTDYWSSFVGFVPAEKPVFTMIVVLDKPHCKYHDGGMTAAPTFAKIAEKAVKILEIPLENKDTGELLP